MIRKIKDDMRAEYRELRKNISPEEKLSRDLALCRTAEGLVSFRYAEHVLLYAPEPEEIDVFPIAEAAFAKGKKVYFPRCDKTHHTMRYLRVETLDELAPDSYGICEPPEGNPEYSPDLPGNAICFIPGLVYDRAGFRLGYGKGFYDRYLSSFPGSKIGEIYSDFILGEVPRGRFDVTVDILLTEKGVRATKGSNKTRPGKV